MEIKDYYESREEFSLEYFNFKTTRYKANQSISRSFEWIDFTGKNVLDIGCGVGYYAIPLAPKCKHITGIDISEHNIELARQYSRALGVGNATFVSGDFLEFSPQGTFDVIYIITVLMHIKDLDRAFCKVHSLLKPGGILLISDLNKSFPTRIFKKKNSLPIYLQAFTFSQLEGLLHKNGFDILQESGRLYSLLGRRKPDWVVFSWMEKYGKFWPFKYLGEHIAILAQKQK